ncbi:MAG TPA: M1 family metallopeptidase, partial [Caulobacteraceae bacterium]
QVLIRCRRAHTGRDEVSMRSVILSLIAVFAVAACAPRAAAPTAAAVPPVIAQDPHSFARPAEARVTHVALDLVADFERKSLSGTATLDLQVADGARELVLDTRDLDIRAVRANGQALQFRLGAADPAKGRPLIIQLPEGGARQVTVEYATRPDADALQWLTPAQTAGKVHPYLFSQGQAILTRTWIPTQDSPGIRQTWSARITAPAALRVLMSGEHTNEGQMAGAGRKAWTFRMRHPVPPYLIAIAAGDIAFREIGPRTGVYAEPSVVESYASEFRDNERMVETAEGLYGPYRWGRFDVLVLPPAFPYGGMENPTLTFATPTIMAGDRSLVSLVAHELAHSWSGNLATNAVWSDFWLNESFTDYFTSRIMEALYGRERADMERVLSHRELTDFLAENSGPNTALHADPEGGDPDNTPSEIAYNKGALFLETVESIVGRQRFDAWLRGYFDRHAFSPITSELFLRDIREHLVGGDQALEQRLMLNDWVYQPGLPSNAIVPTSTAFVAVDADAARFAGGAPAASTAWTGWNTQQRLRFLNQLSRSQTPERLAELDRSLGLSNTGNSEIRFAWLQLALANRYQPAVPSLEQFLKSNGRRKFIAPLFTALMAQGEWGQPIARRIYAEARPGYHPVTSGTVDAIVK